MSKICEKCGNMIPDGKDACPVCGWEEYNDEALQAALEEMMRDYDGTKTNENADGKDLGDTMMFDKDQIRKASAKNKKKTQSGSGKQRNRQEGAENTVRDSELEMETVEAVTPEVEQPAMVLPATDGEGEKTEKQEKPADAQPRKKKKPANNGKNSGKNGKKKKKRKKKKGSNTVITVIIVVLILLLLALGGACIAALNTMGFFDSDSGEELLAPPGEQEAAASVEPSEAPAPASEAEPEETPASAEETNDGTYIPELEGVETPPETTDVTCTKFNVTGASDLTLNARGETSQVVYVIQPEEAKANIEWESSDPTIASVDAYGVILGRRGGTCTITGTCGEMSVTINVTCDFTVPSTVLDMNFLDITMSYEGQTADLFIDYELDEEQIKSTVWESSDPAVATVDSNGTVTAVADGTAVISASIGQYTASCIVRCVAVTGNKGYNNSNSEYAINYEDVTLTRKGEYFQLSLKSVLNNEKPTVTWKSSDTKVATVDSKGIVTAVANGTAEITTTVGEDQFRCIVRVNITAE